MPGNGLPTPPLSSLPSPELQRTWVSVSTQSHQYPTETLWADALGDLESSQQNYVGVDFAWDAVLKHATPSGEPKPDISFLDAKIARPSNLLSVNTDLDFVAPALPSLWQAHPATYPLPSVPSLETPVVSITAPMQDPPAIVPTPPVASVTTPTSPVQMPPAPTAVAAPVRPPPKNNTTVQETASCSTCGEEVLILLLHGTETAVAAPHKMVIACLTCDITSGLLASSLDETRVLTPAPTSQKRKGRGDSARATISCIACTRPVAVGGMRVFVKSGEDRKRDDWVEPAFDVEPVCCSCWQKYKFCSRVSVCGCGFTGKRRKGGGGGGGGRGPR
ncbi:hypothetical protein BDK51DRAFT_38308 [Blyttiomyces helicus]|uniref:Uncharacterized protein n=1 Tax=Blyttiomyces helicus TaxID=388810 RepID=A0A4V1ISB7_9FUNG|nr:hypothetical protein BDK51DRAFT_38308 [Blyttiomyces helicus]|eukprot:RKO92997.1 hypothetical protein BDK51DRAFT_38308 [Blyttiomyces helicus]